ncbi:MAG TPA: SDR family oxidoreductase [Gammaproteobacteria bacterium]|nr:SDR family oxidoreductase [Gammaproteobacteria bacterium]
MIGSPIVLPLTCLSSPDTTPTPSRRSTLPSVLITGASRGLGREFARQYAYAGWTVHAGVRNLHQRSAIEELQHEQIICHQLDVAKHDQILSVNTELAQEPIDLLINNAGFWLGKDEHYGRCDDARWMEEFRVHMFGTMAMCESFVQQVAASKRKLIVNISSGNGSLTLENGIGDYPYNTSKAGLNLITKGLAADLKQRGITVVCFTPGFVATDMSGPDADLTPHESVSAMRAIIDTLGPEQTGTFLRYNGETVPW